MTHRSYLSLVLGWLIAVSASAAPAPTPQDARPLAAGTRAPNPTVRTMEGEATSLESLIAGKPTILIFYRAGWCPYCNQQLAALAETEPQLLALGYQILALSSDDPAGLRATADKQHLNYRLLSDRAMSASEAFGVAFRVDAATVAKYRDYKIDLPPLPGEPEARWLPVPAVFVIARDGMIRFVYSNPDYKIRLSTADLLAAARQAGR